MTNSRRGVPTLAALLTDAAARQATTPTVRAMSQSTRRVQGGDPHISLFTGAATTGHPVARFSFESDPNRKP